MAAWRVVISGKFLLPLREWQDSREKTLETIKKDRNYKLLKGEFEKKCQEYKLLTNTVIELKRSIENGVDALQYFESINNSRNERKSDNPKVSCNIGHDGSRIFCKLSVGDWFAYIDIDLSSDPHMCFCLLVVYGAMPEAELRRLRDEARKPGLHTPAKKIPTDIGGSDKCLGDGTSDSN